MPGPLERQKAALESEVAELKAQKEALEKEVFEIQARSKMLQASRSRHGDHVAYSLEQIRTFRRRLEEQDHVNARLMAKRESLVRSKTDLEKLILAEAEVQAKRREELEEALRELKLVFEEENEKRSQLESAKVTLHAGMIGIRALTFFIQIFTFIDLYRVIESA